MPQDTPDAISPIARVEGGYAVPGFDITRRWLDGRDLTPEMRTEILEVIRVSFNEHPGWFALPVDPQDHFAWKHHEYPVGSSPTLSVDADGRIIGFLGHTRRIWLVRGRPYVAFLGTDHCQLPEWQGRGLQSVILGFNYREWHPSEDFTIGERKHPADRYLAIKRGSIAPANETRDYVRLLRPFTKIRDLIDRVRGTRTHEPRSSAAPLSNTTPVLLSLEQSRIDRLRRVVRRSSSYATSLLARRPAPRGVPWTITTSSHFEDLHEPFITSALTQFEFVGDRSIPYLNWRFCDHRAGPFTVRIAQQDGQYLGYAVTRLLEGRAYLADILALPGRVDVAESLIRDAIDLATNAGASSILTRLPQRHPYRNAVVRAGLVDLGHIAGEMIEPHRPEDPGFAFLDQQDARIHYVLADTDSV